MSAEAPRCHLRGGDYAEARAHALAALPTADPPVRAALRMVLAQACNRLGLAAEALEHAEAAVALQAGWEGQLALGEALVSAGRPFEARQVLEEAVQALREAPHAVPDPVVAQARLGTLLAEAWRACGDPATGFALVNRALTQAEAACGRDSAEAADALHVLASCAQASGRLERARQALGRALEIRQAIDPRHPEVAHTLDALAAVARHRGDAHEAVRLHQRALALWSERVGPDSGPAAACRHGLAQALHRGGDFEGAREELRRAARITASTLGDDHVDTWITRFELGRCELDCGQVEEGLSAMQEARAQVTARLGREHPVVLAMDRWL